MKPCEHLKTTVSVLCPVCGAIQNLGLRQPPTNPTPQPDARAVEKLTPIQKKIVGEIIRLLIYDDIAISPTNIIQSWGETLTEQQVYEQLKRWNDA